MALTHEQDRRIRPELERFAPLLAMTDAAWQERILDHVFMVLGLDPAWADWLPYAREYLRAFRDEGECLSVRGDGRAATPTADTATPSSRPIPGPKYTGSVAAAPVAQRALSAAWDAPVASAATVRSRT